MPGENRRRQTDGRFARKERSQTFRTFSGGKCVLYTAGSYNNAIFACVNLTLKTTVRSTFINNRVKFL